MRRRVIFVVGATLAVSFVAGSAHAACAPLTEADALARADVVFEGVAQPGNLRDDGSLAKPAGFSVIQYIKGTGSRVLSVTDAVDGDPVRFLSGEYWVIYGKLSPDEIVSTSGCYGSYLGNGPKPFAQAPSGPPAPGPSASGNPVGVVGPGLVDGGEVGWGVKAGAGLVGIALVIAIGYGTAKTVIGTA